ncbi:AAA domain-containing protein [Haloprofundus halobius]|uniref:AAA domain-containing protein n=1 Tax=Haloprofundus halobius TaxID=2876194 RepID=UPI001CCE5E74|nr:ATP-binding protein [Haloprofundus halobius]
MHIVREVVDGDRDRPVLAYQTPLESEVEAWPVRGDVDGVLVVPQKVGDEWGAHIRVLEVKSSQTAKTNHQIQAAIYSLQLKSLLSEMPVKISASIVTRDNVVDTMVKSRIDLHELDTFELSTRENDVRLLLEEGGTLDTALLGEDGDPLADHDDPDQPNYRIDARCDGCSNQARCVAYAAFNHDLALLGFSEGVQESLRKHGIEKIDDLVDLFEYPTGEWDRQPTSRTHPKPKDPERVAQIQTSTDISNLVHRAQIAHRFLRQIDPEYEKQWQKKAEGVGPWSEYLVGSGRNLPDDDPNDDSWQRPWNDYPRKSLVRVYPYVQHDHIRDRLVLLAAKVACSRDDSEGEFVVVTTEGLSEDLEAKNDAERALLAEFYSKLTDAIESVRPDLTAEGKRPEEGYLHLYPYSGTQRRYLVDAAKRHPDTEASQTLRTLLGYREDIDQEMVSVLQEDFRSRHVFRYPGLGVVQTVAQFYSREYSFEWEDKRDEYETPLKDVFALGFFETGVPYTEVGEHIVPDAKNGLQVPNDNLTKFYPLVGRHVDVVPLEYLYACEEFDVLDTDWADNEETRADIMRYRHHGGKDSARVSLSDIKDLARAICAAYEYIERCTRGKNAKTEKQPLNLANMGENSLGGSELQQTLIEYQKLEFGSKRRALESRYREPLGQRTANGDAIPFEVVDAPESSDAEDKTLTGRILRQLGNGVPGLSSQTSLSLESGTYVVLTPLEATAEGTLTETEKSPTRYANKVLGVISWVDTSKGTVGISLNWPRNRSKEPHLPNHVGWTRDADDEWNRQLIEEGMTFVADEALDNFPANRARSALQHAGTNDIHNRLLGVYEATDPTALRYDEPFCDSEAIESFLEAFDDAMPERTNAQQKSFVRRLHHSVSGLQGPPGTGKTSYASAPAILSRAYANHDGDKSFIGVGAAHSNTAVDEIASAVGEAQEALEAAGKSKPVTLVRVRSGSPTGVLPKNVVELSAYEDRDELVGLFELALDGGDPLVVFSTPVSLRNTVASIRDLLDSDAGDVEELMSAGTARVFDYALIDEASMMDLPLVFLLGAFLREHRQIQLVGDHRQMQPIQSHDWESEDRQTIEEHTPAVSALDFVRFLRGETQDELEYLKREPPSWDDPDNVLPMDRLVTTYRLPPAMARLETELFYHRDGIELESAASGKRLPDIRTSETPEWLRAALDPSTRVTLLLHDDQQFTKDSPVEAYLAECLLRDLPTVASGPGPDEVSAGIVVPFRLMRRRLQEDHIGVPVDTVERYQGNEKDVMVLAMTAGNQGYVNSRAEFLLDANRFNVGASRMKRKLFIIASKALFKAVSPDVKRYEDQKAWKQLYRALAVSETANPPSVTLTSAEVPELVDGREVTVEVYTGFRD